MRCCVDFAFSHPYSQGNESLNQSTVPINEFQICKKSEIQEGKIEMEMTIKSEINDEEVLEECKNLYYSVEIGELHERDKFSWSELIEVQQSKTKTLEFAFKLNHIK